MNGSGLLVGAVLGLLVGYFLWNSEPEYVKNITDRSVSGDPTENWILLGGGWGGSSQIAVIHGLLDDGDACQVFADALTRDGGQWGCIQAAEYGQ